MQVDIEKLRKDNETLAEEVKKSGCSEQALEAKFKALTDEVARTTAARNEVNAQLAQAVQTAKDLDTEVRRVHHRKADTRNGARQSQSGPRQVQNQQRPLVSPWRRTAEKTTVEGVRKQHVAERAIHTNQEGRIGKTRIRNTRIRSSRQSWQSESEH